MSSPVVEEDGFSALAALDRAAGRGSELSQCISEAFSRDLIDAHAIRHIAKSVRKQKHEPSYYLEKWLKKVKYARDLDEWEAEQVSLDVPEPDDSAAQPSGDRHPSEIVESNENEIVGHLERDETSTFIELGDESMLPPQAPNPSSENQSEVAGSALGDMILESSEFAAAALAKEDADSDDSDVMNASPPPPPANEPSPHDRRRSQAFMEKILLTNFQSDQNDDDFDDGTQTTAAASSSDDDSPSRQVKDANGLRFQDFSDGDTDEGAAPGTGDETLSVSAPPPPAAEPTDTQRRQSENFAAHMQTVRLVTEIQRRVRGWRARRRTKRIRQDEIMTTATMLESLHAYGPNTPRASSESTDGRLIHDIVTSLQGENMMLRSGAKFIADSTTLLELQCSSLQGQLQENQSTIHRIKSTSELIARKTVARVERLLQEERKRAESLREQVTLLLHDQQESLLASGRRQQQLLELREEVVQARAATDRVEQQLAEKDATVRAQAKEIARLRRALTAASAAVHKSV